LSGQDGATVADDLRQAADGSCIAGAPRNLTVDARLAGERGSRNSALVAVIQDRR
jgi:hypothetical protein